MKYKHVYAAHEVRMWVMTIISGVSVAASILAANPELKEKVKRAFKPKKTIRIVVVEEE